MDIGSIDIVLSLICISSFGYRDDFCSLSNCRTVPELSEIFIMYARGLDISFSQSFIMPRGKSSAPVDFVRFKERSCFSLKK